MKPITQTDISKNVERLIELRGNPSRKQIERDTAYHGVKVTSTTLGNLLNEPEARSPWVKTIITLAKTLGVDAWVLMVKDAPLDVAMTHKVKKISSDGYLLLHAFENAEPMVRYALLESAAHALCKTDERASHEIKEAQGKYLIKKNE